MPPDDGNLEQTICFCHFVSRGDLLKAIRGGQDTLEKVQEATRASTGCGGCECDVMEILEKELKAR